MCLDSWHGYNIIYHNLLISIRGVFYIRPCDTRKMLEIILKTKPKQHVSCHSKKLKTKITYKPDKGFHIVVDRSALTNSSNNCAKIIIGQNHVGSFFCNL